MGAQAPSKQVRRRTPSCVFQIRASYPGHAVAPAHAESNGAKWHNHKTHMRFNPYDDVQINPSTVSAVAIQSLTGSSAVNGDALDTQGIFESLMVHVRAEIASGSPTTSTVAWKLQESADNSSWADAVDNTGTVIGATLNVKTLAQDSYARVEGIMLYNTSASAAPYGGRKRYLRIVLTPAYSGGSSPATLTYAEFVGSPGNGQPLPVRTTVSNT